MTLYSIRMSRAKGVTFINISIQTWCPPPPVIITTTHDHQSSLFLLESRIAHWPPLDRTDKPRPQNDNAIKRIEMTQLRTSRPCNAIHILEAHFTALIRGSEK